MKHVKRLRKKLYALKQEENIEFVHGIGKRKSPLQKSIETLEGHLETSERIHKETAHLWEKKQLFQNRSRCNFHADERRCNGKWAVKASI